MPIDDAQVIAFSCVALARADECLLRIFSRIWWPNRGDLLLAAVDTLTAQAPDDEEQLGSILKSVRLLFNNGCRDATRALRHARHPIIAEAARFINSTHEDEPWIDRGVDRLDQWSTSESSVHSTDKLIIRLIANQSVPVDSLIESLLSRHRNELVRERAIERIIANPPAHIGRSMYAHPLDLISLDLLASIGATPLDEFLVHAAAHRLGRPAAELDRSKRLANDRSYRRQDELDPQRVSQTRLFEMDIWVRDDLASVVLWLVREALSDKSPFTAIASTRLPLIVDLLLLNARPHHGPATQTIRLDDLVTQIAVRAVDDDAHTRRYARELAVELSSAFPNVPTAIARHVDHAYLVQQLRDQTELRRSRAAQEGRRSWYDTSLDDGPTFSFPQSYDPEDDPLVGGPTDPPPPDPPWLRRFRELIRKFRRSPGRAFSVTGPTQVSRGDTASVAVWAHIPREVQRVVDLASQVGHAQATHGVDTVKTTAPSCFVELEVPAINFRAHAPLVLHREPTSVVFAVPPIDTCGTLVGVVRIRDPGGQLLAKLGFVFSTIPSPSEAEIDDLTNRSEVFRSAFLSYARKDIDRVLERLQGMLVIVPELSVFFDVISMRAGEDWKLRAQREIKDREAFLLFWSPAAAASK